MTLLTVSVFVLVVNFLGGTEIALAIFSALLLIAPIWKICTKAGHPGWYSLVTFIPLLNIIALYLLAFTEWPIEREKGDLRRT